MFFNRSIRRKMWAGLVAVFVLLLLLAFSGVSGLLSYRDVVTDLDFSINQAPRRADLVAAVGVLLEPLLIEPPQTAETAAAQRQLFEQKLAVAHDRIVDYHRRLDQLPPTEAVQARRPISDALLRQIDEGLDVLEGLQTSLADPRMNAATVHHLLVQISKLQTLAQRVPEYQDGLQNTLKEAQGMYRSRFRMILIAVGLASIGFVVFGIYGHYVIIVPMRKLHQGAIRVAGGEFNYRLVPRTRDEMAELAEAFNLMTSRFQENQADLDRQVRERSNQLVRSERLASFGFLAAGVAHEINNPLSAICMAAESLEMRLMEQVAQMSEAMPTQDGANESLPSLAGSGDGRSTAIGSEDIEVFQYYLAMILREGSRCQQITRRLLDFARRPDSRKTSTEIVSVISEVLELVQAMNKFRDRKIEFVPTGECLAEVNAAEIKQVVLNIVSNGLESTDPGGGIRIQVIEQIEHVMIRFEDNGCGMSEETLTNLFEPFFTRRRDGKGTGLGMSISHQIVSDHGGTIQAESDGPGEGSCFIITLPRRAVSQAAA